MSDYEEFDNASIIDRIIRVQNDSLEPITRELAKYHKRFHPTSLFATMTFKQQCMTQRSGYTRLEEIYRGVTADRQKYKLQMQSVMGSGYRDVSEQINATVLACHLLVPYVVQEFIDDASELYTALDVVIDGYHKIVNEFMQDLDGCVHASIDAARTSTLKTIDELALDHQNAPNEDTVSLPKLTDRETDVLRLVGLGFENGEVSARLHISMNTTKGHIRSLLAKTGMHNRTQLALLASAAELVNQSDVNQALTSVMNS